MKTKIFIRQMYLLFSLRSEVIYEKCSSENLPQEVSIKEVEKDEKSAPELKSEENFIPISSRFFENQPYEICSNEGKGKEKKKDRGEGKEDKKKKAMAALLVFIIATLQIVFGR